MELRFDHNRRNVVIMLGHDTFKTLTHRGIDVENSSYVNPNKEYNTCAVKCPTFGDEDEFFARVEAHPLTYVFKRIQGTETDYTLKVRGMPSAPIHIYRRVNEGRTKLFCTAAVRQRELFLIMTIYSTYLFGDRSLVGENVVL